MCVSGFLKNKIGKMFLVVWVGRRSFEALLLGNTAIHPQINHESYLSGDGINHLIPFVYWLSMLNRIFIYLFLAILGVRTIWFLRNNTILWKFQEIKESVQSDFRHQVSLLIKPMLQVNVAQPAVILFLFLFFPPPHPPFSVLNGAPLKRIF